MLLSLALLGALFPLALSAPFPTIRTPLLAFSSPSPFLGLDDADAFTNPAIGHIAFIPGLHACGVLNVWSVEPSLEEGDWDLLARSAGETNATAGAGIWDRYESSSSKALETEAVEGVILAWAEGWKKTCGKKVPGGRGRKAMGEVRVSKVFVDGPADKKGDREGWVKELATHVQPLLDSLPPPSETNSVIFLTSLSPTTLLRLFDLASPPPSSPPSSPSTPPFPVPTARRRKSLFARLTAFFFNLLLLAAVALLVIKVWERVKSHRPSGAMGNGSGIALPTGLTPQEEREFQFEVEGASEDEDGSAGELPRIVDLPLQQGKRGQGQ
ncbi:hypothetical protein JCM11251_000870 [Rhodosporidiobolus azoricus]